MSARRARNGTAISGDFSAAPLHSAMQFAAILTTGRSSGLISAAWSGSRPRMCSQSVTIAIFTRWLHTRDSTTTPN
jgi:hypothetical protein